MRASFHTVVLVCRECERRSSGPGGFKSKAVRKTLKQAARGARGEVRVVASSCLGPCPKKAMTVATVSSNAPVAMFALREAAEADSVSAGWPRR